MVVAVESAHTLENKVDPVAAQYPALGRDARAYDRGWSSEFYRLPDVTIRVAVSGTGEVPLSGLSGDVSVGAGDTNRIAGAPESTNPEDIEELAEMFQRVLSLSCEKQEAILPISNCLACTAQKGVDSVISVLRILHFMSEPSTRKEYFAYTLDVLHIYHPRSVKNIKCSETQTLMDTDSGNTIKDGAILGIKNAISYLKTLLNKEIITVEDIKYIHKVVMEPVNPAVAGRFRESQVYVHGTMGVFTPPPAAEVDALMKEFFSQLQILITRNEDPLNIAAFAHYKLVEIHPFMDGNGRTARSLMNLILLKYGYPPVLIKTEQQWYEYCKSLEIAVEGNIQPFLQFTALAVYGVSTCLWRINILNVVLLMVLCILLYLLSYSFCQNIHGCTEHSRNIHGCFVRTCTDWKASRKWL